MNPRSRERARPGWKLAAALLSTLACGQASAAPTSAPARVSIASPSGGQAVAGIIPVAIAFDAGPGFGRVTAVSVWVDDSLHSSRAVVSMGQRGTDYIDVDTRRLANGQHVIRVVAYAGKQVVASDECIVNVSNGGLDSIAPLVSFRGLIDGDTVSGTFDLEVHAVDNDQVQVVSIFVNRWPVLIKSNSPYSVSLDTTRYQDQAGQGTLKLEAWAYDRSNNLGKAKPITLYVANQPNATPKQPDPARPGSLPGGVPQPAAPAPAPSAAPSVPAEPVKSPAEPVLLASRPVATAPEIASAAPPEATAVNRTRSPQPAAPARNAAPAVVNQVVVSLGGTKPASPKAVVVPPAAPKAVVVPPAVPKAVTQVASASIPAKPAAKAPAKAAATDPGGGPLIFARDATAKPNASGRYAMRVFRGRTSPLPKERSYTVRRGDTIYSVAKAHGVTQRSIRVATGLSDTAALRVGMRLRIPGTFQVVLNEQQIAFDVPPRIENGMPLAPFRQIMEYSGGTVWWYPKTQTVRGVNEKAEIELKIGDRQALVNQMPVTLDRAPFIDSGRTMVPIRFVEEALDLQAEFDVKAGAIYLVKK